MKAIRVHNYGGREVLTLDDIPIAEPKPGEARIKIEASGINFIDIYQRTGLYPLKTPFTLGMEGAGVVDAVGEGVTEVKNGNRVAYAMISGSYAEYVTVPAVKLAALPSNLDSKSAAALMLQGMTAHYLENHFIGTGLLGELRLGFGGYRADHASAAHLGDLYEQQTDSSSRGMNQSCFTLVPTRS